jgi:hypothetical protein
VKVNVIDNEYSASASASPRGGKIYSSREKRNPKPDEAVVLNNVASSTKFSVHHETQNKNE